MKVTHQGQKEAKEQMKLVPGDIIELVSGTCPGYRYGIVLHDQIIPLSYRMILIGARGCLTTKTSVGLDGCRS